MSSTDWMSQKFRQPLDRLALASIAILTVILIVLLLAGDHTAPRVRNFSWQDRQVGVDDRGFILTFSRPMDRSSVAENLTIDPSLPGKISWAGRRMAYTLNQPIPYGQKFELQLQGARDSFTQPGDVDSLSDPFIGKFCSRDRAFVYLGASAAEQGRLILYNFTKPRTRVLTPKDLVVMDYKIYPQGDRILFSAIPRTNESKARLSPSLYTVTTGINLDCADDSSDSETPPLKLTKVLDADEYQNLSFDLSPDGQTIIVHRVSLQQASGSGLWVIREGKKPRPLGNKPGGDFVITPDSKAVALLQGQGVAILSLEPNAEPLDFLPKYEMLFDFTRDGTAAAMGTFNRDPEAPTRSLFLVTNQGVETELLRTKGSILDAQFDPTNRILYCLTTELIEGAEYREEPLIAALDIASKKLTTLVILPNQRNTQISVSDDGLGLLFDRENGSVRSSETSSEEASAIDSRLWLIPLDTNAITKETFALLKPERLPFVGLQPRWLP